jgi:hypothetical protein
MRQQSTNQTFGTTKRIVTASKNHITIVQVSNQPMEQLVQSIKPLIQRFRKQQSTN